MKTALFSALNLFELTTTTTLRCVTKEYIVRIFQASQWNQRLAHNLSKVEGCCLHQRLPISNSGLAGTRFHTCKFTSSFRLGLFRSFSFIPSELRNIGHIASDSPIKSSQESMNSWYRSIIFCLFCHLQSSYSALKILDPSINHICPLESSKDDMDKMGEEPSFKINNEYIKSSMQSIQAEATADRPDDVTDVNQKDIPVNHDSFTQEKVPSDSGHETKSDEHFIKETCASEALAGNEVSGLSAEQEGKVTGTECLQSRKHQKSNDDNCDDESFGLDTLFDEDLQRRGTARWTTKRKANAKQRKMTRTLEELVLLSKDDGLSHKSNKKPKRITPNYFLAIRVSNPQIHSGVKIVQDSITTHNEKLMPALIPLATLHLTLMVMHLENAEQIQKATEVLNQCRTSLEPILQNSALKLTFSGLDHFGHQVLFVKLFGDEEMAVLKSVANIVRETFTNEGIPSTDSREFSPHLTVMKLSRDPKLRRKGIKKIPEECYVSWVDMSFGEEPVNALHLCSMNEKKEKDGFYKCVSTVTFDDTANEPRPIETEDTMTEGITAQDNHNGDTSMAQEATNARITVFDKENFVAGENIEENASCDEDLSKEMVTCAVDENMEDSVMNAQSSDVTGDSEENSHRE